MRTKNAIYNNLSSALLQTTILVFGLIIPRLMISSYGSEINGLISSTKQMVSYLKYLELGITASLVFLLYEPLSKSVYSIVNPLLTRAKKDYEKISVVYFISLILLSLIYPLILTETLGYGFVALIVGLVGLYGVLDFYTISKYRVLLDGDQKTYILNIVTTFTTILQNIASLVLILTNQSVILIVFIPILFFPIRSLLLRLYVKSKYPRVDYHSKPSSVKLESRKDAFISGLSDSLNLSLPIVIVSLVISLEIASVFSVYSMVFLGLSSIVGVFNSGLRSVFGNVYARNEKEIFIRSNDYFEFLLYSLLAVLYSTAFSLIIPFIKVYITDGDISYIYPSIGFLFTIWSILHNSRVPNQTMIDATGNWKLITKTNVIQIIILSFGTLILGYFYGINGILLGMIIASLYKTLVLMYVSNKKILNINSKTSILRFIRIFLIIFLSNIPFIFNFIYIEVSNFIEWGIVAVAVVIWSLVITLSINLIFDRKTIKGIINRYIKPFFKRR